MIAVQCIGMIENSENMEILALNHNKKRYNTYKVL